MSDHLCNDLGTKFRSIDFRFERQEKILVFVRKNCCIFVIAISLDGDSVISKLTVIADYVDFII